MATGEQMARLQEQARFVGVAAGNAGVGFDEGRWLSRVRESMAERAAEELGAAAVKVFDVPKVLRSTRPEAYAPHHFALGPYHCRRPELRDMERYKLAAAKRAEKLFAAGKKFDDLVQRFFDIHDKILVPYHSASSGHDGEKGCCLNGKEIEGTSLEEAEPVEKGSSCRERAVEKSVATMGGGVGS
ncbi:hypothetical protein E2562_000362 [Oryza meyeriana var. granulata]|uniref:Uncharacterized protein n=1 Tax=Oryza meyeriana var. granulata TaxID=110450 RepID=A0A6G1CBR5_9ORYZ|nr:hypothetical protein E2562_000362 [Oryza meyeriana var. granulata]